MEFTVVVPADPNIKKKKDSIRTTSPVRDREMARLITVDYAFETETILYDNIENKAKAPSTRLAGNFSFDTLHHDLHGGMLARFRLTSCKTRNCGNVPDVYVSFVQGGNNIKEVLYDPTMFPGEEPRWNFLYAVINAIYTPAENGKGDKQVVDTVYGRCQTYFSRPEDRRFRRQISDCEIKGDLQNTKVDADIVVIDAVELLTFRTPFDKKWGFALESK
uniref:C2 domain-containing protein n=1 Tax=Angiostrongylus cantonensis TaxID=6313 RepID=A0A0K0CZQ1_ANGCA